MANFHLKPNGGGHESHVPVGNLGIDSHGDSHDDFFSTELLSRPVTPTAPDNHPRGSARRKARKIVLCFDGTGNKFHGDDSDSNILKIFRMLDRTASDQCECPPEQPQISEADSFLDHYYQRMFTFWSLAPFPGSNDAHSSKPGLAHMSSPPASATPAPWPG